LGEKGMQDHRKILKQLKMGTTEILILAALTHGDRYGYGISREVFERSNGFFEFKQGFLYPTLRRMEESGLVQSYWKDSVAGGPNRKYYRLTRQGRFRLKRREAAWTEFSHKFNHMLAAAKR
jgi:PadR family transcriptional regulator PadR